MISLLDSHINLQYPIVTMGTFDGVHLGHQRLLKKVISQAKRMKGESVVITYYHHPKEILTDSLSTYLLTEKERKTSILKDLGIDHVVYLNFDQEMAQMKAEEFLRKILLEKIKMKEIVFGYDCHFGYKREGDYHFLKNNEKKYGYRAFLIKPVKIKGKIVSSSLIRNLIRVGEVGEAKKYLGRFYDLKATVTTGSGIGRKIGYPTLNLLPTDPYKLLPANGVYLGRALVNGKKFFCLTNIGYCPTLKELDEKTVETFLLDFDVQTKIERINVSFITRLRDEVKFPDKDSLVKAIRRDQQTAESLIRELRSESDLDIEVR
ncbi:MAG: bifunctional riboflavin kinase/FAD synthetase [Candidatus Cloacimonetes bacterium]|nr:bifunctional riboflavin kinase/FAD synthetase [Candidatus Cloacimonadota bacterium]